MTKSIPEMVVMTQADFQGLTAKITEMEEKLSSIANPKEDRVYNLMSACKILGGISKRTLFTYRKQGLINVSKAGRKVFVRQSDIDNFLQKSHISSRS